MQKQKFKVVLAIVPLMGMMLLTTSPVSARHVDDGFGVVISVGPQKYGFEPGESVIISGEVHALRNGFPLLLKVFNSKNYPCGFQQLALDHDMRFRSKPIDLKGTLCGINGEYRVTVHYGSAKAVTGFYVGGSGDALTGGKAEVINAQIVADFLKDGNKYPVDLDLTTNTVLVRNNMDQTITLYLVFAEFDANGFTEGLSHMQITLEPYNIEYVGAPFVPQIIDGKPDGYLHVFAWTSMSAPTPLHPGLYVPY